MEFGVLGPLAVTRAGVPLDLGRPQQRALLAALVIEANRVVERDRLIDWLWPEVAPARAAATVQVYVSGLRRVLEPDRERAAAGTVLLTRAPGYLLRVAEGELDAQRFEASAGQARSALARGDPARADALAEQALGLWRGPAFVEFAGMEFARAETARLAELKASTVEDRLQAGLGLGRHAALVGELEALVVRHPLRERPRALLMRALYRCDRQADALAVYEATRRMLDEELGLRPSAGLRALHQAILAQDPALAWTPTGSVPTGALAATADNPHIDGETRAGLAGRDPELRLLEDALTAARSGHGRVVLLGGEPGIGKTRLAEEVAAPSRSRAVATGWGRCFDGEGAPAFWPWIQVLRELLSAGDAALLRSALGSDAAVIAQVVPEVAELVTGLTAPPALGSAAARFQVYDAVSGFLIRYSARRPLLLVLDDLQWADVPSLQLLEFLAARVEPTALLVVGTYRDTDVAGTPALELALAGLARQSSATRLPVRGLAPADVARLLAHTVGAPVAGDVAAAVHARTEGNPFFVGELARLLERHDTLTGTASSSALPPGVREVISRRLARLPDPTVALLSQAAVVGREFDLAVLDALAAGAGDVLDAIEAALGTGLVSEARGRPGRYRFSHDLVRETLYQQLSAVRRARLHWAVGEALEGLGAATDADRSGELARHFVLGVSAGDPDTAIRYAVDASGRAVTQLAFEQAAAYLRDALRVLGGLPSGPVRDQRELDLQVEMVRLLGLTDGYGASAAGAACSRARDLVARLGVTHELAPALYRVFLFYAVRADYAPAAELAEQLLAMARTSTDPLLVVAADIAAGSVALFTGQPQTATDHLSHAVALAETSHDRAPEDLFTAAPHPAVTSRAFLAIGLSLLGRQQAAEQESRTALD
ncbi:MAG: BTAD domain-containing putative transcriptional regulator, partial [Sciscionella sp.]